ncbi:response regulator [Paenibacillus koleovorans]|uniref:response regulator n=1 Tax=Paenibacillus koleovorans TaxID=121608 RepID=UPI000FD904FE|nr:response regulator [Paenibacillus koleovorans]
MRKVMIVDDESVTRSHIRRSFPWTDWLCMICGEAENGVKALELFRLEQPDIVLIDLTMPEMDGFALLEKLRDETTPHSSIVLTAHRDFDFVRKAMALGASGYILKSPIDPDSAKSAIERASKLLDERRSNREQQDSHRYLIRNYRYSLRRKWMEDLFSGATADEREKYIKPLLQSA